MNKDYQKPEIEIINLTTVETVTTGLAPGMSGGTIVSPFEL